MGEFHSNYKRTVCHCVCSHCTESCCPFRGKHDCSSVALQQDSCRMYMQVINGDNVSTCILLTVDSLPWIQVLSGEMR